MRSARSSAPSGAPSRPPAGPARSQSTPTRFAMLRTASHWVSSPEAASTDHSESSSSADTPPGKRRAMTNSERGVKFRRQQQERENALETATDKLRREVARLQALKAMREGALLVQNFTENSSPLKFVREYFTQFRFGVAGASTTPVSMMATTLIQQKAFLEAMIEPGTLLGTRPAAAAIMGGLIRKTQDHSSFRLECQSAQLVSVGTGAVVVTTGFTHLRYSRYTLQQLYPHVLHHEELVAKLVGRQLHVSFTMRMYFGERGRLVNVEVEPDLVTALYEVLRNAEECAFVLGEAHIKKFVIGQQQQAETPADDQQEAARPVSSPQNRFEELVEPEDEPPQRCTPSSSVPSDLAFILS